MAEGGEGEQAPEVALGERQAGSVEDADDGEGDQVGRRARAWTGKRPMWKRSME
jgi:hypothetical protein